MNSVGLIPRLRQALAEQSCGRNTAETYCWWAGKLYRFTGKPATQWTGKDVQSWMWQLSQQNYSPVSRKQALCAAAFIFKHVLKSDMGKLELPPMPRIRETLRTIPTRQEIGRIFSGLNGQVKLMAGLMYGSGLRVTRGAKVAPTLLLSATHPAAIMELRPRLYRLQADLKSTGIVEVRWI